ncbi:MAG: hypothetical protein RI894_541, partial [Bacteroidota bacterium]
KPTQAIHSAKEWIKDNLVSFARS